MRLTFEKSGIWIFCVVAALCVFIAPVRAQDYGPNPNDYDDYGHVGNGYTGGGSYNDGTNGEHPIDANGGFCGATSVANSMEFLANKYGGVYDDLLEDGSAEDTRNTIVDMQDLDYNATTKTYDGPANNHTIWNSKVNYINDSIDPDLISIEGVIDQSVYEDTSDTYEQPGNTDLTFTDSTSYFDWEDFLQEQIEKGQDVEIAFSGTNVGGDEKLAADQVCHMVTLMNIDSEGDYVQYLDPNATGAPIDAEFTLNPITGELEFTWDNDSNTAATVTVNEAWAESPVPEPAWGCLLLVGRLMIYRKR